MDDSAHPDLVLDEPEVDADRSKTLPLDDTDGDDICDDRDDPSISEADPGPRNEADNVQATVSAPTYSDPAASEQSESHCQPLTLTMPTMQSIVETHTSTNRGGDASSDQEQTEDPQARRVRTKRRIVLDGCICGEVVLEVDKESNLAMTCKVLGCETIWVSFSKSEYIWLTDTFMSVIVSSCMHEV
jgi:hypothetical protein